MSSGVDPTRDRTPRAAAHRGASRADVVAAGAEVLYRESPLDHAIDPAFVRELRSWLPR